MTMPDDYSNPAAVAAFDHAMQASLPQGHALALKQMRGELSALLTETMHLD